MRSTMYSWLGVMSRYWTIEFKVGIEEAFITAACFRLLMLASGREVVKPVRLVCLCACVYSSR